MACASTRIDKHACPCVSSGHEADGEIARAAEEYGYHLGLAYQIIDDVLDFTSASDELGKPAMADVSLGLSTAPVLYAAENIPEMRPMIKRKFKQEGDVERTLRFVLQSNGIDRSRDLALFHAQRAVNALCRYSASIVYTPGFAPGEGSVRLSRVAFCLARGVG